MFEIAWGVPDSMSMKRKRYEISYTIEDAVTNYRDCAEFYGQFLGEDFGISEKVLEHLKIQFKEETNAYDYHFCHYDNLRIFQDSLSVRMQQILNSGSSKFSSAEGFGGGFSSRRRWKEPVAEEDRNIL